MATVLFVTPHQDDETLSMGAAIRLHLEAGHEVHVLELTTGVNSGARAKTGLDKPTFGAARDDEYMRACRRLGVRFATVHFAAVRTEDGLLTVEAASVAVTEFLAERPGAWVKGYSDRPAPGRHEDHVVVGEALAALHAAGVITNLRFYVEPWLLADFRATNPGVSVSPEQAANVGVVRNALDEYKALDQVGGKYGIGYISVPTFFDLVRANPVSYFHVP